MESQGDILDLSEVSDLARRAILEILYIDKARREKRSAYIEKDPYIFSPYRDAMVRIFQLYTVSYDWKWQREKLLEERGGRCERCGAPATVAHHKDYRDWALADAELPSLEALCVKCHKARHAERDHPEVPFWAKRSPIVDTVTSSALRRVMQGMNL